MQVFLAVCVLVSGAVAWRLAPVSTGAPVHRIFTGEQRTLTPVTPTAPLSKALPRGPFFRVVYGYGGTPRTPAQEGHRYRAMVMQHDDAGVIPRLRARNPRLKVFMYADMMSTDPRAPDGVPGWVGYTDADANHPDWFLRDPDGNRLVFVGNETSHVMDVGNVAYQNAGLDQVIAKAKAGGFNGVFLDDANASLRWVIAGGSVECPTYPTDAAWQAAVRSFLANVTPQLHQAGLSVIANIGGSTVTPGLWQSWNRRLDGAMEESFGNGGAGRDSIEDGQWLPKLRHALWSEAHGKLSLDHTVTSTRRGARYGFATMLLAANGENLFSASEGAYTTEVWWPEYRTARSLGSPTGRYRVLRGGIYRRTFAHGLVLVNPHVTTSRRVRLRGTYSGSGLGRIRSVVLGPTSGVVLVRRS